MSKKDAEKKELIAEIQNRFNLILVVAIFYPSMVSWLQATDDAAKAGATALTLSIPIAMYFLAYLLFEIFKKRIRIGILKAINIFSLIGIGIFLPSIFIIAMHQNQPINFWLGWPLIVSIWGIPSVAAIIVSIIGMGAAFPEK